MEEKINEYLRKSLATFEIPFSYEDVKLVRSKYYDDKNFEIETLFTKFNGSDTNHKNVLNCYDGNLTQIMFQDSGFPGASINFDRQLIPDEAIPCVIKAASFNQRYKELSEDIKKANI